MERSDDARRIAIEIRGIVNGAQVAADGEARAAKDSSVVDLRIESHEDAIGWDPVLVAPAIVDGVLLAALLAVDDEDHVPASFATQTELVDEDGREMGRARIVECPKLLTGRSRARFRCKSPRHDSQLRSASASPASTRPTRHALCPPVAVAT